MNSSKLHVKQASVQSFARFGTFVAASEGAPFEGGNTASYREKAGVIDAGGGRVSVGVLNLKARPLAVSELERHVATPELLVAVEGDVVIPVAPANHPGVNPDVHAVEVFRLNQGEAVILNTGVWHGLPFPLDESATLLVIFKEDTPSRDFELCNLAERRGTSFEVAL